MTSLVARTLCAPSEMKSSASVPRAVLPSLAVRRSQTPSVPGQAATVTVSTVIQTFLED